MSEEQIRQFAQALQQALAFGPRYAIIKEFDRAHRGLGALAAHIGEGLHLERILSTDTASLLLRKMVLHESAMTAKNSVLSMIALWPDLSMDDVVYLIDKSVKKIGAEVGWFARDLNSFLPDMKKLIRARRDLAPHGLSDTHPLVRLLLNLLAHTNADIRCFSQRFLAALHYRAEQSALDTGECWYTAMDAPMKRKQML